MFGFAFIESGENPASTAKYKIDYKIIFFTCQAIFLQMRLSHWEYKKNVCSAKQTVPLNFGKFQS